MNFFASIGRAVMTALEHIGRLALFTARALAALVSPPIYTRLILGQMMRIGYYSLPVVGLTAFFMRRRAGAADLSGRQPFRRRGHRAPGGGAGRHPRIWAGDRRPDDRGRVAAAIAAEIGTMKVTEQIDALTTLSTNPFKYLVVPRIVAAVISMPILTAIGDSIGVLGGYVVSVYSLDFNGSSYLKNTWDFAHQDDITSGLIKAAVFGFIVAVMGCYNGFNSKGGAQGVGNATTNAVVASSILILAADYVLTALLFHR